jgi:hypothetical protein
MKRFFSFLLLITFALSPSSLRAEMTGGAYQIYADSLSVVNGTDITGGSYSLTGTGGELSPTSTSGGTYTLRGGFQAAEKGILSVDISAASISLGTLTVASVASDSLTVTVSTDSETGYTLSLAEDGNLRTGVGDTIDDVADGSVTAGVEEYGIRTTGADGLLATDTAISGSVAVASATSTVSSRQTTVLFSTGISAATPAGSYQHTVTFTVTVNP